MRIYFSNLDTLLKIINPRIWILDYKGINQEENKLDAEKPKPLATQPKQLNRYNYLNTSNLDRTLNANADISNSDIAAIITEEKISRPKMSTPSTLKEKSIINVSAIQRLEWIRRPLETSRQLPELSEKLIATPISRYRHKASLTSPWFVELGGGIGRALSNSEIINATQGAFRLNIESKWYSWSTSFRIGYQFDNRWYTSIGFDINQTKNRFDFRRSNVSSLVVSDNENFQVTNSDFFNTGETRYTYADLGLSIGKRVNIDRWHFSLEEGAIFNVLINANGKVQVGDLEFSRLEDQQEYFNTQIGIGARLSAMLDYPISDQLWISLGPAYHQYFNTVSADANPIKERNAILQVKARVRYHF